MMAVHDESWAAAEIKLQYASFHYLEMQRSLQRREMTTMDVAQMTAGAIPGYNWQQSFYPHFDAFLAAARSVPMIIETCFGADYGGPRAIRNWLKDIGNLDPDELCRRKEFSKQFKSHHAAFRDHPLTKVRDIVTHRGTAPIEVRISGFFGVVYVGNPRQPIPTSETSPASDASTDPGHLFMRSQSRLPVEPGTGIFTVNGQPLFPLCADYLNVAQAVLSEARRISEQVHGKNNLSPQPP
jgi:hypothetical protein